MSETIENENGVSTPSPSLSGRIHDMGLLDLRSAKTPEDLKGITGINDVGCIIIPENLATALMGIPMNDVGTIIPMPEGNNVQLHVGQIKLSGEAIAAGDPEDILFVAGQLIITTPVTNVGYQAIWAHGQILAIRGSETALGAKLKRLTGQILYLPAKARTVMGSESIGKAFLELLPEPTAMVIMGELTIEDDVTVELLQSKIVEFVLMGVIKAPKPLIPLVQVLTPEKMGEIVTN